MQLEIVDSIIDGMFGITGKKQFHNDTNLMDAEFEGKPADFIDWTTNTGYWDLTPFNYDA